MHYIFPKKFAKILYISEPISEETAFCSILRKKPGHISILRGLQTAKEDYRILKIQ